MLLEKDIEDFKKWAMKLGLSSNNIPKDDILKSIFKSKQSTFLYGLTGRILPRKEAREIKMNVLIQKINSSKHQITPTHSRNNLPVELQKYFKMKELKNENYEIRNEITEIKEKHDLLMNSIQTKSIQKVKLKQKHDALLIKIAVLEEKHNKYLEKINEENDIKEKFILYTPVRAMPNNMDEELAYDCVKEMYKCLNDFYEIYFNNSDSNIIRDVHDALWKKLKHICNKTPNYLIWNVLLNIKNTQLENMKALNNKSSSIQQDNYEHYNNDNDDNNSNSISKFELSILKTEASIISIISKLCTLKDDFKTLEQSFKEYYPQFINSIKFKLNLSSSSSSSTDIEINEKISKFIMELNIKNNRLASLEFLKKEIDNYTKLINNNNIQIDNHKKLLTNTKQIYNDIELMFNRIKNDIKLLGDIKEKIIYSRNYLQIITSKNFDQTNNIIGRNNKLEITKTTDSFENSYNSNILCSTKIDLNNSIATSNKQSPRYDTAVTSCTDNILPSYVNEITTFNCISFENIDFMPKECISYLKTNPILTYSTDVKTLSQLELPISILTLNGLINEIINNCNFSLILQKPHNEIQVYQSDLEVDKNQILHKKEQQKQQIIEILHEMEVNGIKVGHSFKKFEKYLNFFINCPLKNYISSNNLINDKKYTDYEMEFQTFYRMATLGLSITSKPNTFF